MPAANAALHFHPAAIRGEGGRLMGIHVANEGFIDAFARHADVDRFICLVGGKAHAEHFAQIVRARRGSAAIAAIDRRDARALAEPGCLQSLDPQLTRFLWQRRAVGAQAFSICGLTHTIASEGAMQSIGDLVLAPTEEWDALVCTSQAVKEAVGVQFDAIDAYLRDRFGASRTARPQLEVIPLGVDCDRLAPDPGAREAWRAKLGIGADDVAALFVGRLSFHAKANPFPMYAALERAARGRDGRLHLIQAGWFANAAIEKAFRSGAQEFAPSVVAHFLDGRGAEMRRAIWSAGDIFVALVDNVQETFGLAPVEAMAAGLPAVVSDWNGYKDTVRDGVDGFRVPTAMAPPGAGELLAQRYGAGADDYDRFVGAASQSVAVDIDAAAEAIGRLAGDAALRRRLGESARARARSDFDWRVVIPRYQALWAELAERRRAAARRPRGAGSANPFLIDPFRLFAGYSSAAVAPDHRLEAVEGAQERLGELLRSPLASHCAYARPTDDEMAAMMQAIAPEGGTTAERALGRLPPERRDRAWRGLLWLAKYGLVRLKPRR